MALLCAELVGSTGEVVGTDLAKASVARASQRKKSTGAGRVTLIADIGRTTTMVGRSELGAWKRKG